jgi:hypothetical protein
MESESQPYVIMPVSCSICGSKQFVRVVAHAGPRKISHQTVGCIRCNAEFDALVPGVVIGKSFTYN